jgi:hypothetical protein
MFLRTIMSHSEKQGANVLRHISILIPLLGLYLAVSVFGSSSTFEGDEGGYVASAIRMFHGPAKLLAQAQEEEQAQDLSQQDLRLWWGPGYSLFLGPLIILRLPWIVMRCFNAGLLFGGIVYFYALLRRYLPANAALVSAFALGLYPPFLRDEPKLVSESMTILLVCGFMFHFCALYNNPKRYRFHLAAASIYLAYLSLTKVFYGYVVVTMLALEFILLLWRQTYRMRNAFLVFLLALIFCTPYLWYTHSLTGRTFYWGTSGGMSLYWMSTPNPNELGSWFSVKQVKQEPELAPHREFFAKLEGLSDVERDDAFKKQAIYNITHHPAKYAKNWAANVGRLLFSYPFSFGSDRLTTYFYMLPNMFVVVLFLLSLFSAGLRPKAIPFEMWALLIFALIAFGGSTFVSAYDRQFRPLVPITCAWTAFLYFRVLQINFRDETRPLSLHTNGDEGRGVLSNAAN